jgi:hypothetical protein
LEDDMKIAQLALVAMALVAFSTLTAAAGADTTTPATLQGEVLVGDPLTYTPLDRSHCNPNGTSTLSFDVNGTATGPFPGTFTESGTATIGPQVGADFGGRGVASGQVTALDAQFTILSGETTITGTKHVTSLPTPAPQQQYPSQQAGVCTSFEHAPFSGFADTTGSIAQVDAYTTYAATIAAPSGSSSDQGYAATNVGDTSFVIHNPLPGQPGSTGSFGFVERFFSLPATVTLTPVAATNTVGTSHTVTATALDTAGRPVAGVLIGFVVTGSTSVNGSCTTDAAGQCSFTYGGPELPGADSIQAYADVNRNFQQDTGEPFGVATKAWVLPASTSGQTTGGGQFDGPDGEDIAFGFTAKGADRGLKGMCVVVDPSTHTIIKCIDVTGYVQVGTHVYFTGHATLNGVATTYRIDVDDLGEPGAGRDTFKIQADGGYLAGGILEHGNIQVRS